MFSLWFKIINNPEELIKANHLWWKTPGANWRQNIFFNSQYTRDGILLENSNAKKLIELNKYIITIDSQDNSRCEKKFKLKYTFADEPGQRSGDIVNIVSIPYILFLIPKNISKKLIEKKDFEDILFIITSDGKKYINNTLKNRIKNGPPCEQEYSYLSNQKDPYLTKPADDRIKRLIDNLSNNINDTFISTWYKQNFNSFQNIMKYFDIGYIMSNAMANGKTCSPDDDIYQRLLTLVAAASY